MFLFPFTRKLPFTLLHFLPHFTLPTILSCFHSCHFFEIACQDLYIANSLLSKSMVTSLFLPYWASGNILSIWNTLLSQLLWTHSLWFHMYVNIKSTWSLFTSLPFLPGQSSLGPYFVISMLIALKFTYLAQASLLNTTLICTDAYWMSSLEFLISISNLTRQKWNS